jgi:hypothetical protein
MKAFKTHCSQNGSVLVITAVFALLVMMGMAGLAIDMSHAYTNKTRLQNLADSLALSAAISMSKKENSAAITDVEKYAEFYAETQTFPKFLDGSGNGELKSGIKCTEDDPTTDDVNEYCDGQLTFTFSTSLDSDWLAAGGITDAKFVRVEINQMTVATWFANVMGFDDLAVSTTAVAGPAPIIPCDVAPLMMCTNVDEDGDGDFKEEDDVDLDCNDDDRCFGYKKNTVYCMRQSASGNTTETDCPAVPSEYLGMGAGNFSLLDFGEYPEIPYNGANAVRFCMAGDLSCKNAVCKAEKDEDTGLPVVTSQTGVEAGPVAQGLNTRFNDFGGSMKGTYTSYKPDMIVSHTSTLSKNAQTLGSETATNIFENGYKPLQASAFKDATDPGGAYAEYRRRIIPIPMVDCTAFDTNKDGQIGPGDSGGGKDLNVLGFGCFFLTAPVEQKGNAAYIYGEFLGSDICNATGVDTSLYDFGYYRIILYKDPVPHKGLGGMS